MDWKKKIDDGENVRNTEQRNLEEEQKLNHEEQKRRTRKQAIDELGKKFKCHICLTPSQIPLSVDISTERSWVNTGSVFREDWSKPGDLFGCTRCGELTCLEHIYKGICKECAEKM